MAPVAPAVFFTVSWRNPAASLPVAIVDRCRLPQYSGSASIWVNTEVMTLSLTIPMAAMYWFAALVVTPVHEADEVLSFVADVAANGLPDVVQPRKVWTWPYFWPVATFQSHSGSVSDEDVARFQYVYPRQSVDPSVGP